MRDGSSGEAAGPAQQVTNEKTAEKPTIDVEAKTKS